MSTNWSRVKCDRIASWIISFIIWFTGKSRSIDKSKFDTRHSWATTWYWYNFTTNSVTPIPNSNKSTGYNRGHNCFKSNKNSATSGDNGDANRNGKSEKLFKAWSSANSKSDSITKLFVHGWSEADTDTCRCEKWYEETKTISYFLRSIIKRNTRQSYSKSPKGKIIIFEYTVYFVSPNILMNETF